VSFQGKFADEFKKMIPVPHPYDPNMPEKAVLAFVPNDVEKEKALNAGAKEAGGMELIEEIAKGRYDIVSTINYMLHGSTDLVGHSVDGNCSVAATRTFSRGRHCCIPYAD
jgi:hypothetical protein